MCSCDSEPSEPMLTGTHALEEMWSEGVRGAGGTFASRVFTQFSLALSLSLSLAQRLTQTMAANAQNAFHTALQQISFNAATHMVIFKNGFETILDLATVQEEDLDKLPKHLEAWRNPAAAPNQQVCIVFVSLKKLKAMHYWVLTQCCIGEANPCTQDFSEDVLEAILAG